MTKNGTKRILLLIGLMILFVGAAVAYHYSSDRDSKEAVTTRSVSDERVVETVQTPRKERGPRPENKRLRDGAEQIEERGEAIQLARDSLTRIEKEIAGARDDKTRVALERKMALIEKAIAKFSNDDQSPE